LRYNRPEVSPVTPHDSPDDGYYENERPEVVALVPPEARFVIDVGCGAGGLGRHLKSLRPGIEVRGIEPVTAQAERARRVLDDVLVAGAEAPLPAHWPAPDCVIFADVLEHLVEPWDVVRAYRKALRPGGVCVASIPNVANRRVLGGLYRHRWDYAAHGIMDRTHLRFFTRETAVEMFEQGGFSIRQIKRVMEGLSRNVPGRWLKQAIDRESGRERLYPAPLGNLIDAWTFQFLIVAA
jgi:2-polyprenyl-3-methyl-5-hydroxy-6-metoxy-1,4-benzoquinol methylase